MKRVDHALIMAAGRGARMMPMTAVIPKPMAPFLGSTLIINGIRSIRSRIRNIHITVGYKGAMLAEHVIKQNVSTVLNTNDKGNAWWIYHTLMKNLNEPIFVLTCDNIVDLDFDQLEREYCEFNEPACMVVPVKPVQGLEGDYIFQGNNIVTKLDRHEPSKIYCSGIQIINPYKINQLTDEAEDFYGVWDQLIKQKEVYTSNIYPKRWFAVDTMEHLEELIQNSSHFSSLK
jgi:NDP-sugar pyrophosphorylase family protein